MCDCAVLEEAFLEVCFGLLTENVYTIPISKRSPSGAQRPMRVEQNAGHKSHLACPSRTYSSRPIALHSFYKGTLASSSSRSDMA